MAQGDVTCNLTNALPKRCAVFDGVDDYVEVADDDSLDLTEAITISAWVKQNAGDTGYNDIVLKWGGDDSYLFRLRDFEGDGLSGLQFLIDDDGVEGGDRGYVLSANQDFRGNWFYVVGTYDGANLKVYVDGVLKDTDPYPNGIHIGTENLIIGGPDFLFNGSIADVRIYNKALTQAEITKLYQGGNVTRGLVSRWKLDKDYKDSFGSNDGTNSGSYLTTVDDQVSKAISDARTTANDKYLMCVVNNKIMTSVIEEA